MLSCKSVPSHHRLLKTDTNCFTIICDFPLDLCAEREFRDIFLFQKLGKERKKHRKTATFTSTEHPSLLTCWVTDCGLGNRGSNPRRNPAIFLSAAAIKPLLQREMGALPDV
jgi:hypothetical protein